MRAPVAVPAANLLTKADFSKPPRLSGKRREQDFQVAGEEGKIDPMYQFTIKPLFGSAQWEVAGVNIAFTNSALWMLITTVVLIAFVQMGNKRQLIPGRWQMAVETFTGFIDNMLEANIGKAGRKYVPYVFSLFMFINLTVNYSFFILCICTIIRIVTT